jgi:transcriptional regulator with XRE-family HTH domain
MCIMTMTLNPEQIRAARALLNWSRDDLATATALSADTIRRIESGSLQPRISTVAAIKVAFEQRGVEFLPRNGVAQRDETLSVIEGKDFYIKLLDDIYHTLKDVGGEVLFFCADDRNVNPEALLAENRLREAGLRFRNLIEEGNTTIIGSPDEYRTIPSAFFHHELQVTYGSKVAHCLGTKERVIIVNDKSWATMARKTFDLIWYTARPVNGSTQTTCA